MTDINAYSRRVFIRQGALLASFAATLPHFIQQSAFGMLAPDGGAKINLPGDKHLRRKAKRMWVE